MSFLKHVAAAPSKVAAATGIAQDNVIFAMVLFAFVVWITTKGELGTYLAFFTPGAVGPITDPIAASSTAGAGGGAAGAAIAGIAPAITAASPNPGLLGAPNAPGAFTLNPTTGFGAMSEWNASVAKLKSLFGM